MVYGSLTRVKEKLKIGNADSDTELNNILSDVSGLIDFYLDDLETTPVSDTTKLKALNFATNVIAMGEYELRYKKRDEQTGAFAIYNHGWAIFDKYLQKKHGKTIKDLSSAKLVLSEPKWSHRSVG